ncbi:phage tail protein [Streptococcus uberis]|uniref:phage tail protein n=1 Tax=Streptococcus uberis TaxID=1349 RepID=UPI0027DABDD4|nr:phage tail protein [Streptococcus uberis]MCK1240394.1 phage tail protein [Streptococcus uberis]
MRIAIRDTTDSHTVGFFDNKAGIKFNSAEMTQFLKGACSYVTIKYRSKDAEKVRAGCKLAFRHKGKDYWLTINEFSKKGTEVEITAYSLSLEANKEKRGAYKASSAMPIVDYFSVFDPEKSFEIGINEVSDKKLTLEWTGTDTVLARLYSIANSFDAELEFVTELNPNYSLKRHVVNIYRSGNLGGGSTGRPVRVGTELKVLGFNSNINDLYTAIDVTGKDGLKLPDKTIKDAKGEVQFFSKNGRLYAPQARDKFPSNKVNVNDGYILAEAKTTDYTNQEALFGYALSEMKKYCDVQVEYSTEGAVKGSVGDTKTLIDSINFEPTLYVQARITEQTEDLETGKSLKTTFSNFKRTLSQLSNDLTKKIEELAKSAVPYRIVMVTSNGTSFKNGTGQSIVSPKLFKGDVEITDATYRFNFNNNTVAGLSYTVNASAVNGTSVLKIDAYVGNDVVASDELTFINVNDGLNGSKGADGNGIASSVVAYQAGASATVAPTGTWSSSPVSVPAGQFLWTRTIFTYTDTTTKTIYNVSRQGADGAKGADGKDGQNGQIPHIAYADKSTNIFLDSFTNFKSYGGYQGSVITSTLNNGAWDVTASGGTHPMKHIFSFNGTTGKTLWYYIKIKNTHATNPLRIIFNGIDKTGASSFPTVTVNPGQTYVKFEQGICRTGYDFIQINIDAVTADKDIAYTIYDLALYNEQPFINLDFVNGSNKAYMGLYIDEIIQSSTDASKYAWTLIKGQDGSQGIQGPAGADGKTPYWHTAWANSADGKTDFSLTDSKDKQFRGEYIDYTQADSTDPTKYNWIDRTSNVKVGGSNILLNSRFENTSTDPYSFTVGGVTYNTKPDYWSLYNSGIPNATTSYHAYVDKSMSVTNVIAFNESDGSRNWKAINQTVSSRVPNTSKDFMISLDMYATGAGTKAYGGFYYVSKSTGAFNFHAGQFNIVPSAIGKWVRESAKVPFNPDDCDFTKEIRFYIYGYGFTTNSILYIDKVMLENSTVASVHSDAPEELKAIIDSKADQALTQAQMLALEERSALARDNAIAEAMKNTISEVEAKWQTWYNLNTADEKQKVANDIASLLDRVAKFEQNLGEASARFEFINNETLIGEEGVAIGDKEGKAKLFLSNDSISFVTNGVAQMTLTGDTLTIKNGLFTESIQIGNYVEEVYDRNPLYNVIRPIKYS